MEKKVKEFLKKKDEKILLLDHNGKINCLYDWHKIQGAGKIVYNTVVMKLCKYFPPRMKVIFLRALLGMKIGKNVGIAPETDIEPLYPQLIEIGDNAIIGWKTNILCHEFTPNHIRLGRTKIGNNALIGAFSSIRSGVTIGNNSVVAMDSFVNKDIPDNELWGGVPAKFIKKIKSDEI